MFGKASLAFAAAVLTGCAPAPNAEPEPAGGSIRAGLKWESAVTGTGVGLTLTDAGGGPLLRLACVRGPAQMVVTAERFRAIGSEERLSLGVDDEPFVFVADLTAGRPVGVEARGPIPPALLDRLARANAVSVSYGAQTLGPHIPPDPETAARFASACRAVAAERR
jgi:hypothetical protein